MSFDFSKPPPQSHRPYKPTPFSHRPGRDEQRETRRHLWLKRVGEKRDDGRWAARSDELDRSDYFAERHRWEENMARRAQRETAGPALDAEAEVESMIADAENAAEGEAPTVEEIDESWLIYEDPADVDIPDRGQGSPPSPHDDASSTTSWEDEEYENLFMEFISDEDFLLKAANGGDHAMDLSMG